MMRRWLKYALVAAVIVAGCGEETEQPAQGPPGEDGSSCTVSQEDDGVATISCDDGTSVTMDPESGDACTIVEQTEEAAVVDCGGESIEIPTGSDCVVTSVDQAIEVVCDDGAETVIGDVETGVTRLAGAIGGGYFDGAGLDARMDGPMSADMTADGEFIYFTDSFNQTIRRYSTVSDQTVTLAGSPGVDGAVDGVGDEAKFEGPRSIAVDPDHDYVYIADGFNCAIRRLDPTTRQVETFAGQLEFCDGVDGPADMARFGLIIGMTISDDGETLYVADRSNDAIRAVDLVDGEVETIAGQLGVDGHNDGAGDEALFNSPGGIALSEDQSRLYVADMSNGVVRAVDLDDNTVETVAGDPDEGGPDVVEGQGSDIRFGGGSPQGVDRVGDELMVYGFNNTVMSLEEDDGEYSAEIVVGEPGDRDFVDGGFDRARLGIAFGATADPTSNGLYYADRGNDALRHIDFDAERVQTVVGATPDVRSYASGEGLQSRFRSPAAVAVADDGAITYIADSDNHVIRYYDATAGITGLVAGTPEMPGYSDEVFDAARFDTPSGLALNEDETVLYVADTGNAVIRGVDLITLKVDTVAGDPGAGDEDPVDGAIDDAGFGGPVDVEADGDRLYVADVGHAVIRRVDLSGEVVDTLAGGGEVDDPDDWDVDDIDGVGDQAVFASPEGLAVSADGSTLFVTDGSVWFGAEHNAIRAIALADGEVSTVAGLGDGGVDQSQPVAALEATFNSPSHLAVSPSGELLYVADTFLDNIRAVDLAGDQVWPAVGVPGDGTASQHVHVGLEQARLFRPAGIDVVDDGHLIFSADEALFEARLGPESQ